MFAVGCAELQGVRLAKQLVNFSRLGDGFFHAANVEVGIPKRRTGEEGARGERGDDFVKVERHAVGVEIVARLEQWHVTVARPAGDFAAVVVVERRPAAAGDNDADACVEHADEHRVVSAKRVADRADAPGIDLGQRLKQIHATHVVEDALHRAGNVVVRLEVVCVVAERRVVGSDDDVAAPGQFVGVGAVGGAAFFRDAMLAERRGRVQREDAGPFGQAGGLGAIEQGGEAVVFLGDKVDAQPREAVAVGLAAHAHVERREGGAAWQWPHRLLHAVDDLPPPLGPVGGRLDGVFAAGLAAINEQPRVVDAAGLGGQARQHAGEQR